MTNAPGDRPMPPLRRLRAAGVTVCSGSDGVRDAWTPFGTIDIDIEQDGSLLFLSRTGGTVWRVKFNPDGPRMVISRSSSNARL